MAIVAAIVVAAVTNAAIARADPQPRPFLDVRVPVAGAALASAATSPVMRDPLRGGVREVMPLNGFLTGPSKADPARVALAYVATHHALFGLSAADLARLRLVRRYASVDGTTHLLWAEMFRGIPAFDNDLRANVGSNGRLINVLGSPRPGLMVPGTVPGITAAAALAIAARDAGVRLGTPRESREVGAARASSFVSGDSARLTLFADPRHVRLAWRLSVSAGQEADYDYVIDARSGRILRRANTIDSLIDPDEAAQLARAAPAPAPRGSAASGAPDASTAAAPGHALVWNNFPDAPTGGQATDRNLTPYLRTNRLQGNNAHAFADLMGPAEPFRGPTSPAQEIPPQPDGSWSFPFTRFNQGACATGTGCAWDPALPRSWRTNLAQDATQAFWFVNVFHDHLLSNPIGFTEAAGNFQQVNFTGRGRGGDPVLIHIDAGADGPGGLPDKNHVNNAFMATPPDGQSPHMVLFLFKGADGAPDANAGDQADVVDHEYTHGLSNRLITDAQGNGALAGQGGAMGEGWSDWYAMDYLVSTGAIVEHGPGTLRVGVGVLPPWGIRAEAIDCPVGSTAEGCRPHRPAFEPKIGGYTYGDYSRAYVRGPEVHADGTIWAQTLWDLRTALIAAHGPAAGVARAESLITRAMELSPPYPTFLDMRNAIIEADLVSGGTDHNLIGRVFATRGMGYFAAASIDPNEARVIQSFAPFPGPRARLATLSGRVLDQLTGQPLAGAYVVIGGLTGLPGRRYWTVTGHAGRFLLRALPVGTYPLVQVLGDAYEPKDLRVKLTRSRSLTVRVLRDWGSIFSGARVVRSRGHRLAGCAPAHVISQEKTATSRNSPTITGWAARRGGRPSVVVKLARPIDVAQIAIDPEARCGAVDASSSLGRFLLESSVDGRRFVPLAAGRFNYRDNGGLNRVRLRATGRRRVRFLRLTMLSPQGPQPGGEPGLSFRVAVGMTELSVYGRPSAS